MSLIYPTNICSISWPFTETYEDTSVQSKFEDGSLQTRSKFTRSRRKWTLKYKNITKADYDVLMDFVVNQAKFSANAFSWTIPDTTTQVTARITSAPKWSNDNMDFWTGELELTEV